MRRIQAISARRLRLGRKLCCAAVVLLCGVAALGQGQGPRGGGQGPPPGGGMGPPPSQQGQGQGMTPPPGPPPDGRGMSQSTMRGGLQLGPPGLWWDDREFSKSIGLSRDQQRQMDAIFKANKPILQARYKDLQREESQLENVTRAKVLDAKQIFAEIDRVMQARGELEKANARMLLDIRGAMHAEQIERLDAHRTVISPTP